MSQLTQPIHLFLGDEYMRGLRATAEAAPYNVTDAEHPIMRRLDGSTNDTVFQRPIAIVANDWSLEHLFQQIANPGSFVVNTTPANVKVTDVAAPYTSLQVGGDLYNGAQFCMDRVAVEPMFADLTPAVLFLINGAASINGTTPVTVHHDIRPITQLERDGFSIGITPTFVSSAARSDVVLKLGATNAYSVRLILSGGASALQVSVNSLTDTTPTFAHTAAQQLRIIVDWRRKRADVVDVTTRQVLASVVLTRGNWSGQEVIDATFGTFDGTILAPQTLPVYAAPRCDLIVVQMGEAAVSDVALEAERMVNGLSSMRSLPWGSGAPVWIITPSMAVGGTKRAVCWRVGRALENVSVFETEHLTRGLVSGKNVLTGASLVTLMTKLAYDAAPLFAARRRTMARPLRHGYARFSSRTDANAHIQTLIDAGLTVRELSPMDGGVGRRSGGGVDMPWPLCRTVRKADDFHFDPNTGFPGERLVPIDRAALEAGYGAPASSGVLVVPRDTGTETTTAKDPENGATVPDLELAAFIDWKNATTVAVRDKAQLFDPLMRRIERTNTFWGLSLPQLQANPTWTPDANSVVDSTSDADPAGGSIAVRMRDTSASLAGIVSTGVLATSIGASYWVLGWIKRDAASTTFASFCVDESGTLNGVNVDFANGRVTARGTILQRWIGRFGDWYFVAFRYTASVTAPKIAFSPAAGLVSAFPTLSGTVTGSSTLWRPVITAVSPNEIYKNPTPYAYTGQPRVLADRAIFCEGTRTNIITHGDDLSNAAAWFPSSNLSIARYDGPAPDSSPNAWVVGDTGGALANIEHTTTALTSGTAYTLSLYVKRDATTARFPELYVLGAAEASVQLNTSTGATALRATGLSAAARADLVIDEGGVEWWRLALTFTPTTSTAHTVRIYPAMTSSLGTFISSVTGGITCALAQLETGRFASSYIPTNGAAVTRNADQHRFTSAAMNATFYGAGWEVDFWPEFDSGTASQETTQQIFEFLTIANVGVKLVCSSATESLARANLDGSGDNDTAGFTFTRGQKITFSADTGDQNFRVFVDGVQVASTNTNGNFGAYVANTGVVGGSAFGSFSPVRAAL